MYQLDTVQFDSNHNVLRRGDTEVLLDRQSADLLKVLIETNGPVSKDKLMAEVWAGKVVSDAAVTTAIRRLRKAFAQCDDAQPFITTLPKVGYRLAVTVTTSHASSSPDQAQHSRTFNLKYLAGFGLSIVLALSVAFTLINRSSPPPAGYVQAVHLWEQKNPATLSQAINYLEDVLDTHPRYTPAHLLLAHIYAYKMSRYLPLDDDEIIYRAKYHIAEARAQGEHHDEVNLVEAKLAFFYLRDRNTVAEYVAAYADSNRCNAQCHFFIAYVSPVLDQPQAGINHAERAFELKPDSDLYVWERVWSQFMAGNLDMAKTRRTEAARFSGQEHVSVLAMIAQIEDAPERAMQRWLDAALEYGHINSDRYNTLSSQLHADSVSDIAQRLIAHIDAVNIDQHAMLLLLADKPQQALETMLATSSLKVQTHLLWAHKNPVFTSNLTPAQLNQLESHIWGKG